MTDRSELWWREVTGPRSFIEGIAAEILGNKSVALRSGIGLPWRGVLRDMLMEQIRRRGQDDLYLEYLAPEPGDDPAETLLRNYGPVDVRNGYRVASGQKLNEYMLEKGALSSLIVWVKVSGNAKPWLDFARNWNAKSLSDGLLILEAGPSLPAVPGKRVTVMEYDKYIDKYDILLFSGIIAAERRGYNISEKLYVSNLAAALCEGDAEAAAARIDGGDLLNADPAESGLAGTAGASAPHRVWEAQIQTIFPLLELSRRAFIEKHRAPLEDALEYFRSAEGALKQFDVEVTSADDLELGTIFWIMRRRKADNPAEYVCYIPAETERERIGLLHRMRNALAHCGPCDAADVRKFLAEA